MQFAAAGEHGIACGHNDFCAVVADGDFTFEDIVDLGILDMVMGADAGAGLDDHTVEEGSLAHHLFGLIHNVGLDDALAAAQAFTNQMFTIVALVYHKSYLQIYFYICLL